MFVLLPPSPSLSPPLFSRRALISSRQEMKLHCPVSPSRRAGTRGRKGEEVQHWCFLKGMRRLMVSGCEWGHGWTWLRQRQMTPRPENIFINCHTDYHLVNQQVKAHNTATDHRWRCWSKVVEDQWPLHVWQALTFIPLSESMIFSSQRPI